LLDEVARADRLVLLGDVIELRHGPLRDALAAAEPVLRALGGALHCGAEVLVVPGNHDYQLLAPWLESRARPEVPPPLGLETWVDWSAGEPLAAVAGWLAPASVRVAYPGVWLREDVYATHGHYSDRHTTVPMFERLGAGAMARIVREATSGPRGVDDYERTLAPLYAWLYAIAQRGEPELGRSSHGASAQAWQVLKRSGPRRSWRRRGLVAAFPAVVAGLNRAGLGPLSADVSGSELRRAALRAFGEVLARLEITAPYVLFGHTHRAGPLAREHRSEWRAPTGSAILNTGSWVHEPAFLGPVPAESPYRPGFCAILESGGPPELTCLLDGVSSPVRA
jgi:hypothetical protein